MEPELVQRWYRDRFGIHDHPEVWPLNMTKRAHAYCRKAWVEHDLKATVCWCGSTHSWEKAKR